MSASEQGGRIDKEIFRMAKADSREKALAPRKEVGGTKATSTSSGLGLKTWLGLKDPRIVRVSRSFGGKDRHSKVSTVKGLRDRRVRLSVQTAIQLYDLQDRLGLSQPSKVVDWLLNATQHEINKLPPLQMPPAGNFSSIDPFSHSSMELSRPSRRETDQSLELITANDSSNRAKGINMSSTGKTARGLTLSSNASETPWSTSWNKSGINTTTGHHVEGQQQCEDADAAQRGVPLTSNTSFPGIAAAGMYATYFHLEPPNAEPSGAVACSLIPSLAEPNNAYHRPVPLPPPAASLSLMPGPQLMLCPSGTSTAMPSIFQSNYATAPVDYDAKHINLSTHVPPPASQNFFSNSLFASFPSYVPK